MNRGNYRADLFRAAKTRAAFLKGLDETCAKTVVPLHPSQSGAEHREASEAVLQGNLLDVSRKVAAWTRDPEPHWAKKLKWSPNPKA